MKDLENKVSFTPGPWIVQDSTSVFGPVDITAGETCVAVAQAEPGRMEAEANARLIAAAPELLAALTGVKHHNAALKDAYKLSDSLMRQIETAIAKAEGRD